MSDQTPQGAGGSKANYPIPKGLGDLNYLQSLLKSIVSQDLNADSAPTFLSLTLTNLTASELVGTNANKALQSISIGASLSLSGTTLNTIQNIRTSDSPTFAGLTLTTGAGASKVWTSNASGVGSWQTPAPAGVTSVFTRTGAVVAVTNDYTWAQIDKTTSSIADIATRSHTSLTDIGTLTHGTIDGYLDQAVKIASSPTFAAIKLTTGAGANKVLTSDADGDATWAAPAGVAHQLDGADHTVSGLTAGHFLKALSPTTFGFAVHGLTYSDVGAEASGAVATHAALITGVHGLVFTAGKTLTLTESLTLSALPIGSLAIATGANAVGPLAGVAAGQPLLSGGIGTVPAYAGYTFSATAAQTYTFPAATCTLLSTTGSPAALVIASQATGDILYASSATAWARLGIGAAGKALVVNAGGTLPEWGTVLTNPMDDTGQLIYGGVSGAPTKLAAGATTTILVGGGAAAPVWTTATGTGAPMRGTSPTITTSLIMSDGATIGQAAGPLVAFDDTNNYLEITGCNVGIGTTAPSVKLQVLGAGAFQNSAGFPTSGKGIEIVPETSAGIDAIQAYNRDTSAWRSLGLWAGVLTFNISGSERFRIDANSLYTSSWYSYSGLGVQFIRYNDYLTLNTSSERWKTKIERNWKSPLLDDYLKINPIRYEAKEDGKSPPPKEKNRHVLGFSAEELDASGVPGLVVYDDDSLPLGIWNTGFLVYHHLVLQDLNAKYLDMEKRLSDLENKP